MCWLPFLFLPMETPPGALQCHSLQHALLAQVKREWEGAAAFVQALPEGTVPESSTVKVFCMSRCRCSPPCTVRPELPQQEFGWLCQHRDVTHPGDKGAGLAGAVLLGSQAIPVAARRVLAFIQCPQNRSPSQQSGCLVMPVP